MCRILASHASPALTPRVVLLPECHVCGVLQRRTDDEEVGEVEGDAVLRDGLVATLL